MGMPNSNFGGGSHGVAQQLNPYGGAVDSSYQTAFGAHPMGISQGALGVGSAPGQPTGGAPNQSFQSAFGGHPMGVSQAVQPQGVQPQMQPHPMVNQNMPAPRPDDPNFGRVIDDQAFGGGQVVPRPGVVDDKNFGRVIDDPAYGGGVATPQRGVIDDPAYRTGLLGNMRGWNGTRGY